MKKIFIIIVLALELIVNVHAEEISPLFKLREVFNTDSREIKALLHSQVKYANSTDFDKFISTYDENYINADGFDYKSYSSLVKDIWKTYDKIEYGIKIKNISVSENTAIAELVETSFAEIPVSDALDGVLRSEANSVYYLKKINGSWKVTSDHVISETTSMLYGDAKNMDIKLSVPNQIMADTEYTASLEFIPPKDTIAIASIASDKIEYPQSQPEEVFRKMPDDYILERLFISNNDNVNEYVIASIGLTKADVCDLSIKLSLTGFGYQISRVNVIPYNKFVKSEVSVENAEAN